jgi:hypothetical protein
MDFDLTTNRLCDIGIVCEFADSDRCKSGHWRTSRH